MNQILPVGKGVVIAFEHRVPPDTAVRIQHTWREQFPDVPVILASECRILDQASRPIIFEFTGEITPTFVAEFQRWWEEAKGA